MKVHHVCGKRGLGDLISGISSLFKTIEEPSQIIFHYPPGFQYKKTISTLVDEFNHPKVNSFVVDLEWFSISKTKAEKQFGQSFFFTCCYNHTYLPFKTQWKKNLNGPIGLCLNNENYNSGYPFKGKWFSETVNDKLLSLVDEKDYVLLGRPKSLKQNIEAMSECRYVLGVDGAWAHAANSMRVPYYLTANGYDFSFYKFHSKHPTLKLIKEEDVFNYV